MSMLSIIVTCPICGCETAVLVCEDDYLRWQDGELAQNAFPYLLADEREMLISGICPKCWETLFSGEDEE